MTELFLNMAGFDDDDENLYEMAFLAVLTVSCVHCLLSSKNIKNMSFEPWVNQGVKYVVLDMHTLK